MSIKCKYYSFLLSNILRQKAIWIIGMLHILFICVFIFIVPSFLHESPFMLWTNGLINVQSIVSYVGILFCSMLVIYIYKNFRDDGVELIIVSKPITRKWLLFIKLLVFFSITLIMSILILLVGLFIFCFPDVTVSQKTGLIGSLFLSTLLLLTLFGGISLLVSIYLNKIWIILFSLLLCALSNIYYCVTSYTSISKTPAQSYLSNADTTISTVNYFNSDGTFNQYAYIANKNLLEKVDFDKLGDNALYLFEDEKNDWNNRVDNSSFKMANFFDLTSQFHQMYNSFGLNDVLINQSKKTFGSNRRMNYDITKNFMINSFSENSQSFPLTFIDYDKIPYISEEDCKNPLKVALFCSNPTNIAGVLQNDKLITLGTSSQQINEFSSLLTNFSNSDYLFVVSEQNSKEKKYLSENQLDISKKEKKFFDLVLNSQDKIFLKKYNFNQTEYSLPKGLIQYQINPTVLTSKKPFINNNGQIFINNLNSFQFDSPAFVPVDEISHTNNLSFKSFYEYVHFILLNEISIDSNDWIRLNITSNEELMMESLKFKYYIFSNLYEEIMQEKVNDFFKSFANNPKSSLANPEHYFGPIIFPFDTKDFNTFVENELFFNDEYIAINTLLKNFSFAKDKNGYATIKKYPQENPIYLEPTDYTLRSAGNTGNISFTSDFLIMSSLLSFSFNTTQQITGDSLILIWFVVSFGLLAVSYVVYNRIDFK